MSVKGAATLTANILGGRPHWVQLIAGVDDEEPMCIQSILLVVLSLMSIVQPVQFHLTCMVYEDKFREGMNRDEAVEVVARALLASAQRDTASGNGMDVCVITPKDGYQLVPQEEFRGSVQATLIANPIP